MELRNSSRSTLSEQALVITITNPEPAEVGIIDPIRMKLQQELVIKLDTDTSLLHLDSSVDTRLIQSGEKNMLQPTRDLSSPRFTANISHIILNEETL